MEQESTVTVKKKKVLLSNWHFTDPVNKSSLDAILSDRTKRHYLYMISRANNSSPTPSQSNYNVRTSGMTKSGLFVVGSNHEMAITDTITHGEESVIDHALELAGKNDPLKIIAFSGSGNGAPISCCGNCRDAIKEYCSEDLILLSGSLEGGDVSVMKGKDLFFESFRRGNDMVGRNVEHYKYFDQAFYAASTAYDIYANKRNDLIYGAAVVSDLNSYRGSFFGDVAYHPILPIGAAICNFRDSTFDAMRLQRVNELVLVTFGHPKDVPYKDRQHALEFSQSIAAYNGKEDWTVPIRILETDRAGNIGDSWVTSTKEWLPNPFSPVHLGMTAELKKGISKLLIP